MITELQTEQLNGDSVRSLPIKALPTPENGWPPRPFQIVSLLEMFNLNAHRFVQAMELLQYAVTWCNENDQKEFEGPSADALKSFVDGAAKECRNLGFNVSASLADGAAFRLDAENREVFRTSSYAEIQKEIEAIQRAIHEELKTAVFLQIPASGVTYYDDNPQFGEAVALKFPKAVTDIQEAGKTFATGRYTASVFHLMRVMEAATQHLGRKLNILFVHEKNWHNIIEEVDKAIKALPAKNSYQKAKRNRLAEASAHLRMVKDAWRNDVMHPKETYTEEEAERVFRNVKDFMVHLATRL